MAASFKYYSVLLSKTGTGDPTVKDLDSTLGRAIWKRTGVGVCTLTKEGAFKKDKTTPFKAVGFDFDGNKITLEWTSVDVMTLKTYDADDLETLADVDLVDQEINIKVFV